MKKTLAVLATVGAIGATAVMAPAPAEARGIGPGLAFGLAAGAIAAGAAGAYGYYGPGYGYYGYGPYYGPSYYGPGYAYYGGPYWRHRHWHLLLQINSIWTVLTEKLGPMSGLFCARKTLLLPRPSRRASERVP